MIGFLNGHRRLSPFSLKTHSFLVDKSILLSIFVLLSSGCSDDSDGNESSLSSQDVQFTAFTNDYSSGVSTDNKNTFGENDEIGVYAWENNLSTNVASNVIYTFTQNKEWVAKNADNSIKWKTDDAKYMFVGFYPPADMVNLKSFYVDGSNTSIMVAKELDNIVPKDEPVELNFKHISSLVNIIMRKGTFLQNKDITIDSLYISKAIVSANIDLTTDVVTAASENSIKFECDGTDKYSKVLIPQVLDEIKVSMSFDGQEGESAIRQHFNFESGKQYDLEVEIDEPDKLKLLSMDVKDWAGEEKYTGYMQKDEIEVLPIIARSNYRTVTDWFSSGDLEIGVTSKGGGIINQIMLSGIELLSETAQRYGRACQFAARDQGHSGVYNPTQGGYYETLGTPCVLTYSEKKLTIEPRRCSLWQGDGKFDFCEWENIGNDPYAADGLTGGVLGHGKDDDGIDETNLPGQQLDEVASEFDYYGTYEDYKGKYGVDIPIIRHYLELRYTRNPGHCISQFYNGKLKAGGNVTNSKLFQADISKEFPEGTFKGTRDDMNGFIGSYDIRYTDSKWKAPYRYLQKKTGEWVVSDRSAKLRNECTTGDNLYKYFIILAESDNEKEGKALCLFRPESEINTYSTIGVNKATGKVVYKDNRYRGRVIEDNIDTGGLVVTGFNDWTLGILNPSRLTGKYEGCYETYREEYFLIYGTPKQIKDAIQKLENNLNLK